MTILVPLLHSSIPLCGTALTLQLNFSTCTFQSTRPRGARLPLTLCKLSWMAVSIHAPTWGATQRTHQDEFPCHVSIHAPTWGATGELDGDRDGVGFQSTPPRGARLLQDYKFCEYIEFQSTRPRGARPNDISLETRQQRFQSTRPRGARPTGKWKGPLHPCFNPRAHVGRDSLLLTLTICHLSVSIHAPTWGATRTRTECRRRPHVSIHAPTWGATQT